MKVLDLPLDRLFISKNIRTDTDEELGEQISSMAKYGQLQPIGVFPRAAGRYEIVFGHRRFRAAQMNNEQTIACHVLEGISESDIPVIKLQENTVRKQLTTAEVLAAAEALKAKHPGTTDTAISMMLGKNRTWLAMLRSATKAMDELAAAGISVEHLGHLSYTELILMRARLKSDSPKGRASKGSFVRKGVPESGFRIVNSPGPNVVVICATQTEKLKVLRQLRRMEGAVN